MTRARLPYLVCLTLLAVLLVLSGCGQAAIANRKYFLLDATRPADRASSRSPATVQVRQFSVDLAFATRQLVYRVGVSRYEPDFYDQFLIAPGTMLMEQTRDWLADSGLFQRVTSPGSLLAPTYELEGNVLALYGDFTNKSAPEAVVAIRFYLLSAPDDEGSVVLAKTYRAISPIAARTPEAVVDAMSTSLADILKQFEADLQETLARQPNAGAPAAGPGERAPAGLSQSTPST